MNDQSNYENNPETAEIYFDLLKACNRKENQNNMNLIQETLPLAAKFALSIE